MGGSIESTSMDQVCEFLRQEWTALDRERWGDEQVQWSRENHILRAVVDGETAAVAKYYIKGGVAHLSEIIVGRAWRNRGIGGQLMARFEEMAFDAGCHKLSLRTIQDSPAVCFYRRLGYELEGKLVNHYHGLTFLQFFKFLK